MPDKIKSASILIVDDDLDILTAGKLLLKRHYSQVDICNDPVEIPRLMAASDYNVIMLDMNFGPGTSSGEEGFLWLDRILTIDPDAVIVLITAHGGIDVAVAAMKKGATDFISKPWQNEKVIATLSAAIKLRQSRVETANLKRENTVLTEANNASKHDILGNSIAIKNILGVIEKAAPTEANVLILGENGTGKELAARALHQQSARKDNVFLSVDLGSISESLFESELFGYKKGAFTDAKSDRIGRLQAANKGTLFLDEIGNLPLHQQSKLLSVLEQRQVIPVGATVPVNIDVRVIAATNLNQIQLNDTNLFRQDLLFRLNTVELVMPPLRERPEDIPTIAKYYAGIYGKKYSRNPMTFSEAAMQAVQHYHWPGNVRALRHAIERAVILTEADTFQPQDFYFVEQTNQQKKGELNPSATTELQPLTEVHAESRPEEIDSDLNLERLEKDTIGKSLLRHRYNISHAAKDLGLTRAALYRRMEKYGF
jgi:DNA-binding NtrC family response regulator